MPQHPFSEEVLPDVQPGPPLAQLEAISSCHITSCLGEEADPHLATPSFQVVIKSRKVSPEPLLQTKQLQLPQPLLVGASRSFTSFMLLVAQMGHNQIVQRTLV